MKNHITLPLSVLPRLSVYVSFKQFVCSASGHILPKQTAVSLILKKLRIILFKKAYKYFQNWWNLWKIRSILDIYGKLTNSTVYKVFVHVLWHKVLFPAIKLQDSSKYDISKMSWMENLNVGAKKDIL